MDKLKAFFIAMWSIIASLLGVLAIPVLVMVVVNIIDYIIGLIAAPYRSQEINSYKGFKGIAKKVCMWLLVVVGAIVDWLLIFASTSAGIVLPFTFLVASIVAIWVICNELLSILENINDIGVPLPAFLQNIVKYIKKQAEGKINIKEDEQ